ncbi:hypothetical protein VTJ49DRAFT_5027 [Mycothermus thermophilus]|uniref:Uncharacterized protein n=1 Tax=Humicola insolens TaxID=85995 RepID=A0ABR3V462_HUMIN
MPAYQPRCCQCGTMLVISDYCCDCKHRQCDKCITASNQVLIIISNIAAVQHQAATVHHRDDIIISIGSGQVDITPKATT